MSDGSTTSMWVTDFMRDAPASSAPPHEPTPVVPRPPSENGSVETWFRSTDKSGLISTIPRL